MYFYGVDCHSDNIKVCGLENSQQNEIVNTKKIAVSLVKKEQFYSWLESLTKDDIVALESSTNSFYLYDQISPRVKKCYVFDPFMLREIYRSPVKTDYRDAEKIADRVRTVTLVPSSLKVHPAVFVPDTTIRNLRRLFTTKQSFTKAVVTAKNQIHSLIKQEGHLITFSVLCTSNPMVEIKKLNLSTTAIMQIDLYLQTIAETKGKIKEIDKEILRLGESRKGEIQIITSVTGISIIGALAIIADYASIDRFPTHKHFCSYMRSAPGVDSSNKTTYITRVNRRSRKTGIHYLIQGLNHIVNSNDRILSFYNRKKVGKSAGKVRIAVVRKTLVAIYKMLKNKEYYHFRNKELHDKKMHEYERFLEKDKNLKQAA